MTTPKLKYLVLASLLFSACSTPTSDDAACHVTGSIDTKYDGKKIYLVPLYDHRKEVVDSVVISGGAFEFTTKRFNMATIHLGWRDAFGIQQLLIATEPGELKVNIGEVSSAMGTPTNDKINEWKTATEKLNFERTSLKNGNTLNGVHYTPDEAKLKSDSLYKQYKQYSRQLASAVGDSSDFGRFLHNMFPTSYRKRNPDGTTVTIPLD